MTEPSVPSTTERSRARASVPEDAPKFFADAFRAGREANQPIVLAFGAEWCAPCRRLKKETLEAPAVSKLLAKVQVVFVDLDEHPGLGKAYGVVSVPDVFFIDRDGFVADRLRQFEPPDAFLLRLKRLLGE